MMIKVRSILPLLVLVLLGCDRLGIEDPAKAAGLREADGKAAGAACRHAGRSLEDCFERYPQAQKAAVFSGWREMNDYMIQNKMESVPPAAGTSPNNSALSMDPKATDKEVAGEKQAVDATADEKRRTEKPEKPRRAGGA